MDPKNNEITDKIINKLKELINDGDMQSLDRALNNDIVVPASWMAHWELCPILDKDQPDYCHISTLDFVNMIASAAGANKRLKPVYGYQINNDKQGLVGFTAVPLG